MVIHKHAYWADTIFSTMSGPLAKNPLRKWIGVIIRGNYKEASEDIRWEYEKFPYLRPDVELGSDSIYDGSSDEGVKDQENLYDK